MNGNQTKHSLKEKMSLEKLPVGKCLRSYERTQLTRSRYKFLELLGSGAFGSVYTVFDKQEKCFKAIKQLDKENTDDLVKEVWTCLALDEEDYFPRCYDCFRYKNCSFMVMELLGNTLKVINNIHSNGHGWGIETVFNLFLQALSCLKVLHLNGYVHNDIKADNIVMGKGNVSNIVYLIDFGITSKVQRWNDSGFSNDLNDLAVTMATVSRDLLALMSSTDMEETDIMEIISVAHSKGSEPHLDISQVVTVFEQFAKQVERKPYEELPDYDKLDAIIRKPAESLAKERYGKGEGTSELQLEFLLTPQT